HLLHAYYSQPTKDLRVDAVKRVITTYTEQWLGSPTKVPGMYTKASPVTYVHKDAAPIMLLHGTKDVVVPLEQAEHFVRKMRDAGGNVILRTFEGAPHDFDEGNDANARLGTVAARDFLDQHLRKK